MNASSAKSPPAVGFLTVVEHEQHGLFGGYLVLNAAGRPLEFHCTMPIKPNRAQEILFGPALKPYLFGEQIGQALLAKGKAAPVLLCTDVEPALTVREWTAAPTALLLATADDTAANDSAARVLRHDEAHAPAGPRASSLVRFRLGRYELAVGAAYEADREEIFRHAPSILDRLDLAEPFGRIREAIAEAQRGGR
jgi:hypothetical protein